MIYSSEFIPTGQTVSTNPDDDWAIPLTSGGTSICYKCHHDGRLYFQKVLRKEYLNDQRYRAVYRKEHAIGSSLDCPYIVKYIELQDTDDDCCLIQDYVEGDTLDSLLQKYPWFFKSHRAIQKFITQLLEALKYLHERQILHMDINPSNIMITAKSNDVKLVDLGFCYSDSYQDTVGSTRGFSAKEVNDCSCDYDVRTDIYAVGKILEYIKENSSSRLSYKYLHVMRKCLKENKDNRYQSVNDIISYLNNRVIIKQIVFNTLLVAVLIYTFFLFDGPRHVHHLVYGYDFAERTGLKIDIISTDSLTCCVKGYDIDYDERSHSVDGGHVIIPEKITYNNKWYEVRAVANNAFLCDSTITMLSVLSKKITIGEAAFRGCKNLNYITFGSGEITLMPNCFSCLRNIKTFDFPSSLRNIPYVCFSYSRFKQLVIPEGVVSIDQDAFAVNDSLVSVTLPHTLEQIGRGVFYMCPNLREVHIPPYVNTIGMFCFMECPNLQCIYNKAEEPQHVTDIFDEDAHITVYVPRQSVDKYRSADVWKTQNIQPMP